MQNFWEVRSLFSSVWLGIISQNFKLFNTCTFFKKIHFILWIHIRSCSIISKNPSRSNKMNIKWISNECNESLQKFKFLSQAMLRSFFFYQRFCKRSSFHGLASLTRFFCRVSTLSSTAIFCLSTFSILSVMFSF